jgi:DNA-binding response OmpR family regulator
MQALLFSPHADEAAVLTVLLQRAGFAVRSVRSLDQAIEAWPEQPSDFVLITMVEDGTKTIRQIEQMRMYSAIPICVIADSQPEDAQVGILEAGADLFITRPYSVRLLLAQIKALLRCSSGVPFFSLPTLNQLDVSLDPSARTVTVGDHEPKRLTQLEFRLLYTLMTHAGQILPSEKIVEHVWGYTGEGNRELVRGLIQRLRTKVEPDPKKPRYVKTEPGVGYYFDCYEERD